MEKNSKKHDLINKTVNQILSGKQIPKPLPFIPGKLYIFDEQNHLMFKGTDLLNINCNGTMVFGRRKAIFAPIDIKNDEKYQVVRTGQALMYIKHKIDFDLKTVRYEFLHGESTVWIDHIAAEQYFNTQNDQI